MNGTWFSIGIDMLWRQPPYLALYRLNALRPARRQCYANRIQFVHVNTICTAAVNKCYRLTFLALRRLDMVPRLWRPDAVLYPALLQYICPTIEDLGAVVTDNDLLLQRLASHPAPRLGKLRLVMAEYQGTADQGAVVAAAAAAAAAAFERFVDSMVERRPFPLLTSFQLKGDDFSRAGLLDKTFCCLAQCDLLQELIFEEVTEPVELATLTKAISRAENDASRVRNRPPGPFRHLRGIEAAIEATALPVLISLFSAAMAKLHLRSGASHVVFPAISGSAALT